MPPEAHAGAMNEPLTPQEAARVLRDAHAWEGALATRTAGITWMVWGVVTPGVFLSYAFLSVLAELDGVNIPDLLWSFLWAPWIAAGVTITAALWRTAGLAVPALDAPGDRRRAIVGGFVGSLLLFGAFLFLDPQSAVIPLGAVGALWLLMATANVWRTDREGCIVGALTGGALLVSAIAMALLRVGDDVSGTLSILISGIVPFAAGAWHLARG